METAFLKLKNLNLACSFLDISNLILTDSSSSLLTTIIKRLLQQSEIFLFRRLKLSYQVLCFADVLVSDSESANLKLVVQMAFGKYYVRLND